VDGRIMAMRGAGGATQCRSGALGDSSRLLQRPGPAFGLFAAAVDARAAVDEGDTRAALDDLDARAAVDGDGARDAADEDDGRATADAFSAVVAAGQSNGFYPVFAPTAFQSNHKKITQDKMKPTGFVRPGVLFRVIAGFH